MDINDSSGVPTAVYVFIALYLVLFILFVWADVRIIRKAGYSGWWFLVGLVPFVNMVMFLAFAFKEWPIERELAHLRSVLGAGGYPYHQPPGYGYPPPAPPGPR